MTPQAVAGRRACRSRRQAPEQVRTAKWCVASPRSTTTASQQLPVGILVYALERFAVCQPAVPGYDRLMRTCRTLGPQAVRRIGSWRPVGALADTG